MKDKVVMTICHYLGVLIHIEILAEAEVLTEKGRLNRKQLEDLEREWLRQQCALPLPGCAIVGKSLHLSGPRSSPVKCVPIQTKGTALVKHTALNI